MNSLRSLPINRRLWLILVVAILMLIIQGALLLKQIHTDLYAAKAEKTQHIVQSAAGILQHYYDLEAPAV
jgi:methyl-accepting chemotaxis protein